MASIPASITLAGVSKSGSPISRWMMFRPCASSARALARVSKAVSVPRRAMRLANRSSVGMVTVLIFLCSIKTGLLVDRLLLALRPENMRNRIRHAARGLLKVADLEIAQQAQRQHLPAKHDQHRGRDQQRAMFPHHAGMPEKLGEHQPEGHAHAA